MTIRIATLADAAIVASLAGELGYPTSTEEMKERLAGVIDSREDAVFVAVHGRMVVAWVHVAIVRTLESSVFAEIRGLVVSESLRSRGIGASLVEAAEQWAYKQGVGRIRVRSNALRERTHRFYERLGYVTKKTQKAFEKPLADPQSPASFQANGDA